MSVFVFHVSIVCLFCLDICTCTQTCQCRPVTIELYIYIHVHVYTLSCFIMHICVCLSFKDLSIVGQNLCRNRWIRLLLCSVAMCVRFPRYPPSSCLLHTVEAKQEGDCWGPGLLPWRTPSSRGQSTEYQCPCNLYEWSIHVCIVSCVHVSHSLTCTLYFHS